MKMSMKKTVVLSGISISLLLFILSLRMVKPGYVGVVVDLFGSSQGVEATERSVGVHFIPGI